jgi:hypothetical protein
MQTEETKSADRNGAYGILGAVFFSSIFGFGYLLAISFSTGDPVHVLDPTNDAAGYAIGQVFYDAFHSTYGSGVGGIVALGAVGVAIWFGGIVCITSNSRCIHFHRGDCKLSYRKFVAILHRLYFVPRRTD